MPPASVPRRVEDIIYYYYSKLVIATSAGFKGNYGFIIDAYKRLKSGEIQMSDYERELFHLAEMPNVCIFCGAKEEGCQLVHLIPRTFGIKPGMHNIVYACNVCSASKGDRDLVQWWCGGLKKSKDKLPRVPIGLYLKMAHELHKINFSLNKSCKGLDCLLPLADRN